MKGLDVGALYLQAHLIPLRPAVSSLGISGAGEGSVDGCSGPCSRGSPVDWVGTESLTWRPGLILARKKRQILSGKLIEEKEGPSSENLL